MTTKTISKGGKPAAKKKAAAKKIAAPTPMTAAERMADKRARDRAAGRSDIIVRCHYDDADLVRAYAAKLSAKRARAAKSQM